MSYVRDRGFLKRTAVLAALVLTCTQAYADHAEFNGISVGTLKITLDEAIQSYVSIDFGDADLPYNSTSAIGNARVLRGVGERSTSSTSASAIYGYEVTLGLGPIAGEADSPFGRATARSNGLSHTLTITNSGSLEIDVLMDFSYVDELSVSAAGENAAAMMSSLMYVSEGGLLFDDMRFYSQVNSGQTSPPADGRRTLGVEVGPNSSRTFRMAGGLDGVAQVVPVPSAFWIGLALLGTLGIRRRTKQGR